MPARYPVLDRAVQLSSGAGAGQPVGLVQVTDSGRELLAPPGVVTESVSVPDHVVDGAATVLLTVMEPPAWMAWVPEPPLAPDHW
jgi:hypothetical protein